VACLTAFLGLVEASLALDALIDSRRPLGAAIRTTVARCLVGLSGPLDRVREVVQISPHRVQQPHCRTYANVALADLKPAYVGVARLGSGGNVSLREPGSRP
jgi:hypothetical protein